MAKILIIDDDEDILVALELALQAGGFNVLTAATAQEGIQAILTARPDLVILDVMMDTLYQGFEVARAIREEHHLTALPIIMLSSIHSVRSVPYRFAPDGEYLPVDVFLDKPVEPEALIETIKDLLGELRQEPKHPL